MIGNTIAGFLGTGVAASTTAYESIATTTVGGGGSSSISFSSIPATYTHLQIRAFPQSNRTTYGQDGMNLTFNGTTSTYTWHYLSGNGGGANASSYSGTPQFITLGDRPIGTGVSSTFGSVIIDILDYANTSKYKTTRTLSGVDTNGLVSGYGGTVNLSSGLWQSTSAINSITLAPQIGTLFNQYSSFALYGIKGA